MDPRQRADLSKPAQQRLRRAPVLGGFETHLAECAPPSGDLGELALRPFGQPSRGPLQERPGDVGTSGAAVTPVTDKVATDSWGNWSSSCGEWLNSIGYRLSAARRPASRT
jgi:hypothetical protein